ncbi:ATP-binding protein [Tuwongella immobilis]|uniref:ATP-grasp domain-containing protein n=1 Tax=Tuwongella immobilis TaxID=692036 RepID=A0A6C2YNG6_9BACT|nr:cyanophycin synthetase [Tuwongella immobilis]VIP02831.1 cyanophycin synthetase : Cyanophycin synthetase OS=Singulisphaera acidiphila (strain ATCC BAA-1392 / DSM 18658 / VKM B-2454 / MOB10) GN=Sinac_4976 PE=4 SV=1: ATP-grasp_4 [Tuwongella immobilis]VTS02581.1 cyanophycin synthetase : Cyanophycin synthetase OS=Singulisphaera acidiphila (strain ATCC BAA-1392 / DSM 18658 / VKM B-2454 / MOB10) GN=Sinac_4976 PE=4 SV=1: ATP-grasp_4 [Tuwongella immobilis]
MECSQIRMLHGVNRWSRGPVLVATLHWTDSEASQVASIEQTVISPTLPQLLPASPQTLPRLIVDVALELQRISGSPVSFGETPPDFASHSAPIIVALEEERIARAALTMACDWLDAVCAGRLFPFEERLAELKALAYDIRLGPSTSAIVRAATRRGIPFRRIGTGSLVFFGHGVHQRRVCTAETGFTSAIAETIAQDKELTRELLIALGVPVPLGRPVSDAADAWRAAQEIGLPVVVKPQYGNHGRGVATNLHTQSQVERAYALAIEEGSSILVEQYLEGDDYRLLVVGGKLVAAARREPAHVIGDGQSTITQLIERVNRDPRRSDGHGTVLSIIKLDGIALQVLAEQGMNPESVPAAGQRILIRRNANLSTGGTATDVTEMVHPLTARRAVEASQAVGLDIAGVDVVCRDITQSLESQRGGIVEVNAGPGLRMHLEPSGGSPQPVGEAIVDLLYRPGENGRVPIVLVGGGAGRGRTAATIREMLRMAGHRVGHAGSQGVQVDGEPIPHLAGMSLAATRAILGNPAVTAAVIEVDPARIEEHGLGLDAADVVVFADSEIPPPDLACSAVLVRAVQDTGAVILPAEDNHLRQLLDQIPTSTIKRILVSDQPLSAPLRSHVSTGGIGYGVQDGSVARFTGENRTRFIQASAYPFGPGTTRLAAMATADVLRIPHESLLATLPNLDAPNVPIRVLSAAGTATIVCESAVLPLVIAGIEALPHHSRSLLMLADWRDATGKPGIPASVSGAFDRLILAGGTMPNPEPGRLTETYTLPSLAEAIDLAHRLRKSDELWLVVIDSLERTLGEIAQRLQTTPPR